jgi:predicted phosphodiesterase
MTQFKTRWLHISDFHFKSDSSYDRDSVLGAFIGSIKQITNRSGKIDFIIATGDIANSGKSEEYKNASVFFDKLLEEVGLSRKELIVLPGNHDVDRKASAALIRTLSTRAESDNFFEPQKSILHIKERQSAFSEWYNSYFSGLRHFDQNSTCGDIIALSFAGAKVSVLPINSATFSIDDSDHGKLWVGRRCLEPRIAELKSSDADIKIAALHHPLDWLNQGELPAIKALLRSVADCILNGHLHVSDVEVAAGTFGASIHFAAGATYQTTEFPNRALVVSAEGGELTVLPIRYEDQIIPTWTVDVSLYPDEVHFQKKFYIPRYAGLSRLEAAQALVAVEKGTKREFEGDLFVNTSGGVIYVEPRLMSAPQGIDFDGMAAAQEIKLTTIINDTTSYLVETKPEYGGTTLCKRLVYEFSQVAGGNVQFKDARTLPNYKKKLEQLFPHEVTTSTTSVLILDHFDTDRDERLIKELASLGWFKRIIAVCVNRNNRLSPIAEIDAKLNFTRAYLWGISRADVRSVASKIFESSDDTLLSGVVDRVYGDLLGLCIPLTPANVIMYLKILHREGEFYPINRVDILGRYLLDALRKPSDAYRDSFNAKNKLDVLSAFSYQMYSEKKQEFDDRYWHNFVSDYQEKTLTEFDGALLLNELVESRIAVRFGDIIFFKYGFFFVFFMGRHIASRGDLLAKYLNESEFLSVDASVDVITGLSSENTAVVETLTKALEDQLKAFSERYIRAEFDPLGKALWAESGDEEEKLWKPVAEQIERGPRSTQEIDILKSSWVSEGRTADQQVRFEKFVEVETSLFKMINLLEDALKNSDDVEGSLKLRAYDAVLRGYLVGFQVGTVFAEEIAKSRYFKWGGIAFINVGQLARIEDAATPELIGPTILGLRNGFTSSAAEKLGTKKLGAVFRAREGRSPEVGFLELLNFACTLSAKGKNWDAILGSLIQRTDKNAYYLRSMLRMLAKHLETEILQTKDRESVKRLIAFIKAKRTFKKQNPGSKAIEAVLTKLEEKNAFGAPPKSEGGEG